ncbi:MAG: hypothetical protein WC264_02360 [Candidatus Paceibacterota bacterium]|jgi:hypothetical protein
MEPEKKSHGALIGSIIVIIILIIGGLYIWQSNAKNTTNKPPETPTPIDTASVTDELNTLEQDLNSVDSTVDVDINSVQ